MVTKLSLQRTTTHRTLPLRLWQWLVVGAVVIVDVLLGAALIFFQPGTRTFTETGIVPPAPTMAPAPALPPGTDAYYYWGQHRPLDQQP
jgi:hypothetical protein